MAKINLRPWREELRAEKQRQFLVLLGGALVVAAGLVFLWQNHVNGMISHQQSRNSYIENAMTSLDKQIAEIRDLRERREELLSRMQVIQDLQGLRPVIVRAFDELVRTLPDGLYYTKLEKANEKVSIVGMAESNSRISSLMRNFERSNWFADPNLTNVSSADSRRAGYSQFNMTVTQVVPEPEVEETQ
ncbi:MAG: PilN domain-containing protein [Oleiphilaceae bacterium]|nr:PilN domain-containing protein [Oleiphilaceae bacterium]